MNAHIIQLLLSLCSFTVRGYPHRYNIYAILELLPYDGYSILIFKSGELRGGHSSTLNQIEYVQMRTAS